MDETLLRATHKLLELARTPAPEDAGPLPEGRAALNEPCIELLLRAAEQADPGTLSRLVELLLPGLEAPDFYQSSRVAQVLAALVERGGSARAAAAPVIERLEQQLEAVAPFLEQASAADADEAASDEASLVTRSSRLEIAGFRAWRSLGSMMLAASSLLAHDTGARLQARRRERLVRILGEHESLHASGWLLWELLQMADGDELIVLHPDAGKGFRVQLEAVRNNFHLFTLLQCCLLGDEGRLPGVPPEPHACRAAFGREPPAAGATVRAAWHYYQWPALQPDGSLRAMPWSLWGEQRPGEILPFDGVRLVLLGPRLLRPRGWDLSLCAPLHAALRPKLRLLAELGREEVDAWIERIRLAPRTAELTEGTARPLA